MKKITNFLLISVLLFSLGACNKGDNGTPGADGTNGTNGKDGANGKDGKDGKDGNANVMQFTYGSRTFIGSESYELPPTITQGLLDSSLVLAYYNPAGQDATSWYPVPGLGANALYNTRSYWYNQSNVETFFVRLMALDNLVSYPLEVTFTKFKIVIVPASTATQLTAKGVDPNVYGQIRSEFKLQD